MITFDAAIDDYLHTIVRTRPWTKKHEEALLEEFSAWLDTQPTLPVSLDTITPALVDEYAAVTALHTDTHNELLNALNNVYMWSVHTEAVSYNPFAAVTA